MKKKLLFSSFVSIILCFSLICGATFALFTSESKVNVAVTSGTVKVEAYLKDAPVLSSELGTNLSETTATYSKDSNTVTVTNMVPGDIVNFSIDVYNLSDVTIKYQTIIEVVNDTGLLDALEITIGDGIGSKSAWETLAPAEDNTVAIANVPVEIKMPQEVKDAKYQGQTLEFSYTVSAIQGNADVYFDITNNNIGSITKYSANQTYRFDDTFAGGIDLTKQDVTVEEGAIFNFKNVVTPSLQLPAKVVISGDNNITISETASTSLFSATTDTSSVKKAIVVNGNVTFTDGTLNVTSDDYFIYSNGVPAVITIDGMDVTANKGIEICTGEEEDATLEIKNSTVNLGAANSVNVKTPNGSAKLDIVNSKLVCGNIFVGEHTNNLPKTTATFNVNNSYISCEENGLGSTIAIWGQEGVSSKIVNSEIHTYSRGWHQSEDANDNSITFQTGAENNIEIINSNMHLYGARSIINARNYGSGNYTADFKITESLIWVTTKSNHGEETIPVWGATEITDSALIFVKRVHNTEPAIAKSFLYGNPVINGTLGVVTQAQWDIDVAVENRTVTFANDAQISLYEGAGAHSFVIGEGGTVVVKNGASIGNIVIKAADGYTLNTVTENGDTTYTVTAK